MTVRLRGQSPTVTDPSPEPTSADVVRVRHVYCRLCFPDPEPTAGSLCGAYRAAKARDRRLWGGPRNQPCVVCADLVRAGRCLSGHGPAPAPPWWSR